MGRAVTLRADFDGPELRLLAKSSKDAFPPGAAADGCYPAALLAA